MSNTITISGQTAGQKKALFPDWQLAPPERWYSAPDAIPLRALITEVVRAELAAFRERRQNNQTLQVLTADQIQQGLFKGKIDSGGREPEPPDLPDEPAAVTAALEAFVDGLYFVFVDGRQIEDLDTPVQLGPASTVNFLRLVALAGG